MTEVETAKVDCTLIQIAGILQRHLRANSVFKDVNLFKTDDSTFVEFRQTLDARMKQLVAMGMDVKKNFCRSHHS